MAAADTLTVDVRSAIKGLEDIDRKIGKKYVRKALRASAKPTLAVAKSTAPVRTGLLQQNLKLKSAGQRKGVFRMAVGIGKKWYVGDFFYAAFVAFGHRVGNRKLGDARKVVPPNEWLTKAYDSTKEGAIAIFRETIMDLIDSGE